MPDVGVGPCQLSGTVHDCSTSLTHLTVLTLCRPCAPYSASLQDHELCALRQGIVQPGICRISRDMHPQVVSMQPLSG